MHRIQPVIIESNPISIKPGDCQGITKTVEMPTKDEYKILTGSYKESRGSWRGEPCVHPAFPDSFPAEE